MPAAAAGTGLAWAWQQSKDYVFSGQLGESRVPLRTHGCVCGLTTPQKVGAALTALSSVRKLEVEGK